MGQSDFDEFSTHLTKQSCRIKNRVLEVQEKIHNLILRMGIFHIVSHAGIARWAVEIIFLGSLSTGSAFEAVKIAFVVIVKQIAKNTVIFSEFVTAEYASVSKTIATSRISNDLSIPHLQIETHFSDELCNVRQLLHMTFLTS